MKRKATTAGVPRSISRFTRKQRKWWFGEGEFSRRDGRIEDQLRQIRNRPRDPEAVERARQAFEEALKTWPKHGGTHEQG